MVRSGRAGGIRTRGLLVPNEALYQAEPRPDRCDRLITSTQTAESCKLRGRFLRGKQIKSKFAATRKMANAFPAALGLADPPGGLEGAFVREEVFLGLSLLLAVLVLAVLGWAGLMIWLAGRAGRFRERFFPLHSCDQNALEVVSEVLKNLSRESRRYDFVALRVRRGRLQGEDQTFVWGIFGAMALGEGGPEWGSCECVFVLAPRSEEENLRRHAGPSSFIFCGKDCCILRLKESKIREVTFCHPMSS